MKNDPIYSKQDVVTATPAKVGPTGSRKLKQIILYCAADGTAVFKNAATDTGDTLLTISGLAKTTVVINLTDVGGIVFDVAIFCTVTGTGNIAHCWFE